MPQKIQIDHDEVREIVNLISFTSLDLESPTGYIALNSSGSSRTWAVSDGVAALFIRGESDPGHYRLLLSPSQLAFLVAASESGEDPFIVIQDDGQVRLAGQHAELIVPCQAPDHFLFEYDFGSVEPGASGEFNVRELILHLDALLLDVRSKSDTPPTAEVALSEGYLSLVRSLPGVGSTCARLAGRGVTGDVVVTIDVRRFRDILTAFPSDSDITIRLPKFQRNPLVAKGDGVVASLMPWKTETELAREHSESVIKEVFGRLALIMDSDGDYPLKRHGNLVFGRLSDGGSPVAFQVFGVLLRDVASTPELLVEINQINAQVPFAKLIHVEGQLIVESDLVASSMDPIELETAVSKISRAMDDYAATLSVVFGGAKDEDPLAIRWSSYRETVIHAEVSPGDIVHLNGSKAVIPWPFPGEVHVISGWNPQGVALDGGLVNSRIAAEVLQRGGRFVHCDGVSRDGTYSEPSLAIWGINRDVAREIGRLANQDAIFEVVDHELRIVACYTDQVETFPRREGAGTDSIVGYL